MVKDGVLAIVWQDTNLVQFLTTAHDGVAKRWVSRKRPSANNKSVWYRNMVQSIWGDRFVTDVCQPTFAVDYNNFMGGVDIHDQLRCYHPTQLTVLRNWMPLFFWLLDACIINAFLICRSRLGIAATKARDIQNNQRLFRLRLGWNLVMEGGQEMYGQDNETFAAIKAKVLKLRTVHPRLARGVYIKRGTPLPESRLFPGDHTIVHICHDSDRGMVVGYHVILGSRDLRAVRAVRRRVLQGFELFSFLFPSS